MLVAACYEDGSWVEGAELVLICPGDSAVI